MQMNPTCTNRNRTSENWIELQTGMKPLTHVTQMSKPHISNLHKNKSKGQRTGSIVSPEVVPRVHRLHGQRLSRRVKLWGNGIIRINSNFFD